MTSFSFWSLLWRMHDLKAKAYKEWMSWKNKSKMSRNTKFILNNLRSFLTTWWVDTKHWYSSLVIENGTLIESNKLSMTFKMQIVYLILAIIEEKRFKYWQEIVLLYIFYFRFTAWNAHSEYSGPIQYHQIKYELFNNGWRIIFHIGYNFGLFNICLGLMLNSLNLFKYVFYCVYSGTLCIVNNNSKMYSAMQNPWLNIIDLKAVILHLSPKLVSRGQDGNVYWDVLISVLSPPKLLLDGVQNDFICLPHIYQMLE